MRLFASLLLLLVCSQSALAIEAMPTSQPTPAKIAPNLTEEAVNHASFEEGRKSSYGNADTGDASAVNSVTLRAEVMLDRLGFSPGVIDGKPGGNFRHAVQAFETARHLRQTEGLNKKVWSRLVEESGEPVLQDHMLTESDVTGPFMPDLPKDYLALSKRSTLAYRSASQKIAAAFHLGEDLLGALNPGVDLTKAGTTIVVTNTGSPAHRDNVVKVIVDKTKGQVRGYDRHHNLIFAAPATIGSRELPSPTGSYRVKGIAFNPIYYYDPDKNFVQGDLHQKLKLPPGPNNPVGLVFIALTKPTYGLHGTPDPSQIDKTASHGCVRMTNWDALLLAHLVRRGVPVRFRG